MAKFSYDFDFLFDCKNLLLKKLQFSVTSNECLIIELGQKTPAFIHVGAVCIKGQTVQVRFTPAQASEKDGHEITNLFLLICDVIFQTSNTGSFHFFLLHFHNLLGFSCSYLFMLPSVIDRFKLPMYLYPLESYTIFNFYFSRENIIY